MKSSTPDTMSSQPTHTKETSPRCSNRQRITVDPFQALKKRERRNKRLYLETRHLWEGGSVTEMSWDSIPCMFCQPLFVVIRLLMFLLSPNLCNTVKLVALSVCPLSALSRSPHHCVFKPCIKQSYSESNYLNSTWAALPPVCQLCATVTKTYTQRYKSTSELP
jgi:hypothetical protein